MYSIPEDVLYLQICNTSYDSNSAFIPNLPAPLFIVPLKHSFHEDPDSIKILIIPSECTVQLPEYSGVSVAFKQLLILLSV